MWHTKLPASQLLARAAVPFAHQGPELAVLATPGGEGRGFPWVAFPRRNMAADVHHHERVLRECSASEVSEALARAVDWTRSMDSVQGWRARLLLCRTALKREDKLFLNLDQLVELFGRGSGELFEALVTCLKSCRLVQ